MHLNVLMASRFNPRKIYQIYKEQTFLRLLCSTTCLWRTLYRLWFYLKKMDKMQVTMKSRRLQQFSIYYEINKVKSENRVTIYLDGLCYDTHNTPSKGLKDELIN